MRQIQGEKAMAVCTDEETTAELHNFISENGYVTVYSNKGRIVS